MIILRVKYRKIDEMRFLGHLDMVRLMERAFRRAEFPLKFTQGFNPHAKISFAAPLPVGASSDCELLDVELTEPIDIPEMLSRQSDFLPKGIVFTDAKIIEKSAKLMGEVRCSDYVVQWSCQPEMPVELFNEYTEKFLANEEIIIEKINKKKQVKQVNIRQHIVSATPMSAIEGINTVRVRLVTGSSGNLKPETYVKEFCKAFGMDLGDNIIRVHRLNLFGEKDGQLVPLFDLV